MTSAKSTTRAKSVCCVLLVAAIVVTPLPAPAYSVLTHEELIDLAWKDSIRPLLLSRYPGMSEAALAEAHAYAYGGSAIQDMGYYWLEWLRNMTDWFTGSSCSGSRG